MWFYYALATPAIYSVTNFIDKFLVDKKVKTPMVLTVANGFIVACLGIVIGLLGGFRIIPATQLLLILGAGVLLELYIWPYYEALKRDDASRVVPFFQFVPVFVLLLSALILKEALTSRQLFGFSFIFLGGLLLSLEKLEGGIFRPRKAMWFMLLSSFLYASILVLFRFVAKDFGFWTTLTYEYIGTGIGAAILLLLPMIRNVFLHQLREVKQIAGLVVLNNGLGVAAQMAEGFALSIAVAPLVSIVGGTQPVFVLFYGVLLSLRFPHIVKEDISISVIRVKLLTILLIAIGLYFVYL
ncbi:EamA family transporter [Candidatus Gottesmanbacteria bacterium]|nr:EamA family transporter [Candidatus Gottesmanbacteria bacterium]MBI3559613.1 EamA family transporter [Candidatus Gottesmanbacteria bacterium]